MFEIHDEKLGRLKIFNVTEARANFAAVLKEAHSKVVITRHGRPSKILIDYEEYAALLHHTAAKDLDLTEKPNPTPLSPPLPGRWTEKDLDQIVQTITHSIAHR